VDDGVRDGERPKTRERPSCASLRREADDGIEHESGQDRRGLQAFAQTPGNPARPEQQQHHDAPELLERQPPEWRFTVLADSIGANARETSCGVAPAEAPFGVRAEPVQDLGNVERVPGRGDLRWCRR